MLESRTTDDDRPRVRPQDGRQTRQAILATAARLMLVKGYHATALDEVLKASGVGKGNFYYHFKSKEELGHAILDEAVASFLARTLDPCFADPEASRLGQVRCFLDRVVDMVRQRKGEGGCPFGNLACELSDVHEGFRHRLEEVFARWRERLAQALGEARARGEVVADCRPATVAHFLVASLEGAILMTKVTKDVTVMEQCADELQRYLGLYAEGRR